MNVRNSILIMLCLCMCACSRGKDTSSSSVSTADTDKLVAQHEAITTKGILADFVGLLTDNKFDQAILLLHPKLAEAWTKTRFTTDWEMIKKQLPSGWKTEASGSFSGQSPQGAYQQATYRLESNWRSRASLDLVSMKVDGKDKIVKIHIRMPETETPPTHVVSQADKFIDVMLKKDYDTVQSLFSEAGKKQYAPMISGRLGAFLGDKPDSTIRSYYRFCANTVWYDAVQLQKPNDPASYLELIIQSNGVKSEIVSLNFKGRM